MKQKSKKWQSKKEVNININLKLYFNYISYLLWHCNKFEYNDDKQNLNLNYTQMKYLFRCFKKDAFAYIFLVHFLMIIIEICYSILTNVFSAKFNNSNSLSHSLFSDIDWMREHYYIGIFLSTHLVVLMFSI